MSRQSFEIDQGENGLWRVLVPGLTAGALRWILVPGVPFVLLENHDLDDVLRWADVTLPVSTLSSAKVHRVRGVRMDLLYSTPEFLAAVDEFEARGLSLWQLTKPAPDTLRLSEMVGRASAVTLREIGLMLGFELPHAREFALIQAPDRETLERALTRVKEVGTGSAHLTPPS